MALVLVACAVVAAACTTSRLSNTDNVLLHGRVVTQAGTADASVSVLVRKVLSADELRGRMQMVLSSAQLACVASHPPGSCHRAHYEHTADTATDGAFVVHLRGADTQSALGLVASRLQVATRDRAGAGELTGGLASETLRVQATDVALPPLRVWSAHAAVAGGTHVTWSTVQADAPSYRVLFDDGSDGLVWDSGPLAGRTAYDIDPRLLEDTDGAVSVVATSEGPAAGGVVSFAARTPRLHLRSSAGAPASRGRPCTVDIGSGGTHDLSPCPLTDGRFDRPGLPGVTSAPPRCVARGPDCPSLAATVVIDLGAVERGASADPALIVVRGCGSTCAVDISADGRAWSSWGTAAGPDAPLPPPTHPAGQDTSARFVKVSGRPDSVVSLTEVSVWRMGSPALPAQVALVPGTPPSPHGARRSLVLDGIAVILLVVVAVALGAAAGQRRRSAPR